jgi:hypothetical protein
VLSGLNPELFALWQEIATDSSCTCEHCKALRDGPSAYLKLQLRGLVAEARSLDVPLSKVREWVDGFAEGGH